MSSMNKKAVLTKDLFDCSSDFLREYFDNSTYPWELLPQIKEIIKKVLEQGLPGYTLLKEGVLVGENVSISPTATIIPPAIIGNNTEIRPGAYLRGNVIVGDKVRFNFNATMFIITITALLFLALILYFFDMFLNLKLRREVNIYIMNKNYRNQNYKQKTN